MPLRSWFFRWPIVLSLAILALFVLMLLARIGTTNQAIALLLIGEGVVQFAIGTHYRVMRLGTAEILGLGVIFGGLSTAAGTEGWLRVLLSAVGAVLVLIATVRRFREEPD
jgi:hypothetical protein